MTDTAAGAGQGVAEFTVADEPGEVLAASVGEA